MDGLEMKVNVYDLLDIYEKEIIGRLLKSKK